MLGGLDNGEGRKDLDLEEFPGCKKLRAQLMSRRPKEDERPRMKALKTY